MAHPTVTQTPSADAERAKPLIVAAAPREDESEEHGHANPLNALDVGHVVFVAAAAALVWFARGWGMPITVIGVVCALVGGYPIFREAYDNLVHRRMTMELSMAIAIVAALAIRETFTALVITLFVLAAEILEGLTVGRGRRAIQRPARFAAAQRPCGVNGVAGCARSNRSGAGDLSWFVPAADSRGRRRGGGNSFVDQAAITGESLAVEKCPGRAVYAGTINQSGALEIRVERLGRDTTFGRIIEEVERAEKSRAPIQKTADRLAGYLVYFALAAAALTFLITHNVRSTISVVIVAGACGIAAGTPLAILGPSARPREKDAIIKGGLIWKPFHESIRAARQDRDAELRRSRRCLRFVPRRA